MTRAFVPLLKNNLRVMFGVSKDLKQRRKDIVIYVVLAVLMLPILASACVGIYFLSKYADMAIIASMISTIMFASELVVLFFGVQSVISLLFFAKDTELLMALPATGLDIFLAKFTTVYLLHLGLALILQLPVVLAAGIGAAIKNATFYILGFLGSLLTPFIPLFVIMIIAIPLGYVISYFKRNNVIGTILVLLLFAGFFGGYYYLIFAMQNGVQNDNFDVEKLQNIMKILSYIVYPNTFIASSMVTTGLEAFKNFAIFFAIIFCLAVFSVGIAALLYKGSARRGLESGGKTKVKAKENEVKSTSSALLIRDLKSSLGETSSAINYLLGLVITPIIMIMMSLIYGGDNQPGGIAPLVCVAASLAIIFGCGMNYFAIVAFSREGRQMDVLKMLPVRNQTIINQKITLSVIYTILIDLILLVTMFFAKLHFMTVLMLALTVLVAGIAIDILSIYFDLKSPNFVWNNNKELFKNNSKALISMILALPILIVAVAGVICFDVVWANVFADEILRAFISLLPCLIVSFGYLLYALTLVYPKMDALYNNLEI